MNADAVEYAAEILRVLATDPDTCPSRIARDLLEGLTPEQIVERQGVTLFTADLYLHYGNEVLHGIPPRNHWSADHHSGFYRDALNFRALLSDGALEYANRKLREALEVNPRLRTEPLRRGVEMERGESREERHAPTCPECWIQHAGECA